MVNTNTTGKISSTVAYLIGVPEKHFHNEFDPPQEDIFIELEQNKNAKIIRTLCQLRTLIERNSGKIKNEYKYNFRSITNIPEIIPTEYFTFLEANKIHITSKNSKLVDYIMAINKEIMSRISYCKDLFPAWVVWEYIKDLFIMPNGLNAENVLNIFSKDYLPHLNMYPYRMYINWTPEDKGNILTNDAYFLDILYKQNNAEFTDISKVTTTPERTKKDIVAFLKEGQKIDIVVDCENSDPYKLAATLRNTDAIPAQKINKLILVDDANTPNVWRNYDKYVKYPIEYLEMERLLDRKSLVDIGLTTKICKEHYTADVDSFIICSSDSDVWGFIHELNTANFMVLMDREICSNKMQDMMSECGIRYADINNFYSGEGQDIRDKVMAAEIKKRITVDLNVRYILDCVLRENRIQISEDEKEQYFQRHLTKLKTIIAKNGDVALELG